MFCADKVGVQVCSLPADVDGAGDEGWAMTAGRRARLGGLPWGTSGPSLSCVSASCLSKGREHILPHTNSYVPSTPDRPWSHKHSSAVIVCADSRAAAEAGKVFHCENVPRGIPHPVLGFLDYCFLQYHGKGEVSGAAAHLWLGDTAHMRMPHRDAPSIASAALASNTC